jgi:hypothetical protein
LLVANNRAIPSPIEFKYTIGFMRDRLCAALERAIELNPAYRTVTISPSNLSAYPTDGSVPLTVWQHLASTAIAVTGETEVSTTQGGLDLNPSDLHGYARLDSPSPADFAVAARGLIDTTASSLSQSELNDAAAERLRSGSRERGILVHKAGRFVAMTDPLAWAGAYPELFPDGFGTPIVHCRRRRISLVETAERYMRLADNRFALHGTFMFHLFTVLQAERRRRSTSQSLHIGRFLSFAEHRQHLTAENLRLAAETFARVHERGDKPRISHLEDECLQAAMSALFKEIRVVDSRLPLTAAAKQLARKECFALMRFHGPADIFFTITVEVAHRSFVCMVICGLCADRISILL